MLCSPSPPSRPQHVLAACVPAFSRVLLSLTAPLPYLQPVTFASPPPPAPSLFLHLTRCFHRSPAGFGLFPPLLKHKDSGISSHTPAFPCIRCCVCSGNPRMLRTPISPCCRHYPLGWQVAAGHAASSCCVSDVSPVAFCLLSAEGELSLQTCRQGWWSHCIGGSAGASQHCLHRVWHQAGPSPPPALLSAVRSQPLGRKINVLRQRHKKLKEDKNPSLAKVRR